MFTTFYAYVEVDQLNGRYWWDIFSLKPNSCVFVQVSPNGDNSILEIQTLLIIAFSVPPANQSILKFKIIGLGIAAERLATLDSAAIRIESSKKRRFYQLHKDHAPNKSP